MNGNRWRNYGLWMSIASLVLVILQELGIDFSPEQYNEITKTVLYLLVLLGILNNPNTQNRGFLDDK
ncbi:hypothetical protein H0A61_02168 [Koleobacter methoxysyntrophicus]|uniref:Holin n=1 Tax=Koleobacter methoxysyntrophicus TaxID=2751313 RepID=A0A8A0RQW9_9FIRM|nr:hypothetical protein [Koleobacter methoxysyntrophicus]QSQ09787.1 hypothetical protein H0A61_02168 [Koleobacter methoxysyntrophicus]